MSVKQAIILPRVSEKTRQKCRAFVMYAELVGNYKKYGIKSLYDNKMMLS
nr:MAG TPA: Poxvirus A21 Protein [Caudoviricetes sp.]